MFAQQFRTCLTHSVRRTLCVKLSQALHNKSQPLQQKVDEINIPVPWGKVAGKLWGSQDKQPILAMHGWQDNAASFDNLAPLLKTPVLAIDLPGHGLSSWLPPGFMYSEIVYLLLIKRIQKYFGWENIKLMAHSLSGMTTYWYAAIFPADLQYVIALDSYKFPSADVTKYNQLFANGVDMFFKLEDSKGVQPRYAYEELINKALEGYRSFASEMDETACKILMTRGSTQKEDGKYVINRDPRLRSIAIHTIHSQEHQEIYAKNITFPYLIIKGSNFFPEKKENFYRPIEIMKSVNDKVHFKTLPMSPNVTHHFHLTHAEDTAAIINQFLEKYD